MLDGLCVGVPNEPVEPDMPVARGKLAGQPAIGSRPIITNLHFEKRIPMKKKLLIALVWVFTNVLASAQQGPPQQLNGVSAANQMSLSSSLGLHAFPAKDQTPQQRQTDETACYSWAKQDSGFDPIAAGSNAVASGYSAPPAASGIRGAAAGAAGGAAIGAIAGNAGKGAAIGVTAGGIRGRMVQRRAQAEAQQQALAKSQAQKTGLENFKRAFSACMEAKGYSVK